MSICMSISENPKKKHNKISSDYKRAVERRCGYPAVDG